MISELCELHQTVFAFVGLLNGDICGSLASLRASRPGGGGGGLLFCNLTLVKLFEYFAHLPGGRFDDHRLPWGQACFFLISVCVCVCVKSKQVSTVADGNSDEGYLSARAPMSGCFVCVCVFLCFEL